MSNYTLLHELTVYSKQICRGPDLLYSLLSNVRLKSAPTVTYCQEKIRLGKLFFLKNFFDEYLIYINEDHTRRLHKSRDSRDSQ